MAPSGDSIELQFFSFTLTAKDTAFTAILHLLHNISVYVYQVFIYLPENRSHFMKLAVRNDTGPIDVPLFLTGAPV